MPPDEVLLTGGNVAAAVVRIGSTVREPAVPATPAVEALLEHLERAGVDRVPCSLGRGRLGRHVLEFIPGSRAHGAGPMSLRQLARVGAVIRELHDALASSSPAGRPVDRRRPAGP